MAWQVSVAATIWSIWLARNELVFKNSRISRDTLNRLIVHRAFKWITANSWLDESMEKVWCQHPARAIVQYHQSLKSTLWASLSNTFELVTSIDGSWSSKSLQGGMGGLIKTKQSKIIFLFSGPTLMRGSLNSEVEALCHIIKTRPLLSSTMAKLVICTDFKQLESEFNDYVWCQKKESVTGVALSGLGIDLTNISAQHIKREFNNEAHELAIRGRNTGEYKCYWAQ